MASDPALQKSVEQVRAVFKYQDKLASRMLTYGPFLIAFLIATNVQTQNIGSCISLTILLGIFGFIELKLFRNQLQKTHFWFESYIKEGTENIELLKQCAELSRVNAAMHAHNIGLFEDNKKLYDAYKAIGGADISVGPRDRPLH